MITTYITKEELQQYLVLENEELNEQYQQLRKANNAFYVREWKITFRYPFSWKHPFRIRKEIVTRYEVLEDLGGQTRTCCFPATKGDDCSFCTMIDELGLKTFIYGFLNGVNSTLADLKNRNNEPKFNIGQLVKVVDADTMQKICKVHEWTPSKDEERCCGCQFAVYDIRWSYSSKNYVYQLGQFGHCINWVREEFVEEIEEEDIELTEG